MRAQLLQEQEHPLCRLSPLLLEVAPMITSGVSYCAIMDIFVLQLGNALNLKHFVDYAELTA